MGLLSRRDLILNHMLNTTAATIARMAISFFSLMACILLMASTSYFVEDKGWCYSDSLIMCQHTYLSSVAALAVWVILLLITFHRVGMNEEGFLGRRYGILLNINVILASILMISGTVAIAMYSERNQDQIILYAVSIMAIVYFFLVLTMAEQRSTFGIQLILSFVVYMVFGFPFLFFLQPIIGLSQLDAFDDEDVFVIEEKRTNKTNLNNDLQDDIQLHDVDLHDVDLHDVDLHDINYTAKSSNNPSPLPSIDIAASTSASMSTVSSAATSTSATTSISMSTVGKVGTSLFVVFALTINLGFFFIIGSIGATVKITVLCYAFPAAQCLQIFLGMVHNFNLSRLSKKGERKYAIITCKRKRRSGEDDDDDDDGEFKYDNSSSSAVLEMLEERNTKGGKHNRTGLTKGSNQKHGTNVQDLKNRGFVVDVEHMEEM